MELGWILRKLNSKPQLILRDFTSFSVEFASEERFVLSANTTNGDIYQILFTKNGIEYRKKPNGESITDFWYSQVK